MTFSLRRYQTYANVLADAGTRPGHQPAERSGRHKDPGREPRPRRQAPYTCPHGVRHLFAAYELSTDRAYQEDQEPLEVLEILPPPGQPLPSRAPRRHRLHPDQRLREVVNRANVADAALERISWGFLHPTNSRCIEIKMAQFQGPLRQQPNRSHDRPVPASSPQKPRAMRVPWRRNPHRT